MMSFSGCQLLILFLLFSFSFSYDYYYDLRAAQKRHQSQRRWDDYWAVTDLPTDPPTDNGLGFDGYFYRWDPDGDDNQST